MLVGIHTDQYGKFSPFHQKYEEILNHNNIRNIRLDVNEIDFWDKVKSLDLFIFRWAHTDWPKQLAKTILPVIENEMKINCFPSQATCWHYDDKIREYYLLKQHGFPIIDCYIFWDKEKAIKWTETAQYPTVFKLTGGASAMNVVLVKNKQQAIKYIKKMFGKGIDPNNFKFAGSTYNKDINYYKKIHKLGGNIWRKLRGEDFFPYWKIHKNYVLFQKFMPGNDFDTRIVIVGKKAYAFRRFVRKNDFRASGSDDRDFDRTKINLKFVEIGFKISNFLNFQSMAYDFLYDTKGNPALVEISYTYPDFPTFSDGYWNENLKWHEGRYSPQFFQLMEALKMPELKMPKSIVPEH